MTALRVQFQAFIDANLSPAARSATLATMAQQMRDDLIANGQAVPEYTVYVDGVAGADESQVRGTGGGQIMYQFNYMIEASQWALAFVQAWAPVRSGRFKASFYLGIAGQFVTADSFDPSSVPYDAEVYIGNTQPYDRRIDVQLDGTRVLKYSVPSGMWDACARAVQRQFGGTVKASRVGKLSFPGQYVLRRGPNEGRVVDSPGILITPVL